MNFPAAGSTSFPMWRWPTFRSNPSTANDVWGFVDLNTEREYALLGLSNGLAVIDVTDPENPFQVGQVPGMDSLWRDVKMVQVYEEETGRWKSFAYVSTEAADQIMVIDLTGLPNRVSLAGRTTDNQHVP